ncbi:isoleucine--tRNA ligase [Enterobacteriaceae endosymbiont of Neohaemonia nigricornis]|uniref:isoleucine--tRNA ligase n=1 Tax=Enterobacteriaceae endosymbiont of Neohaemonia nigricornis TaxID=2675792 RepID=UPI001449F6CE|nr:isoleucine--tRNA ligase [Enterobacteriaceae endosymbiont of Neohaemonia nigricornis]QJC30263.1 isoleucine--tRNA ligase [Enterobacteriaceae endosymbiont of Neohaemonia nigricornis]
MKNKFKLNLPYTMFPMKANLPINELVILKEWETNNLYQKILNQSKHKKKFILHDGPPYANGNIHIGHAFNKILKDIIIKSKNLDGYFTNFIPGWDCHGLPIEHKIEQKYKNNNMLLSDMEFRLACRKYAQQQIEQQKKDFIRLGIIANWHNPYLTMDYKIEANIIRTFGKVLNNGYIYKGTKPVHWCTKCCSSLAEAEVEYKNKTSLSMYVKFNIINNIQFKKQINIVKDVQISLLIWTTTPWTIPANQAIAVHPEINYKLILIDQEIIIIAQNLIHIIFTKIGIIHWEIIGTLQGKYFNNIQVLNPINNNISKLIISKYVIYKIGTGIIHMAPNHGLDDYNICMKNNIKCIKNIIDKTGHFIIGIHPKLDKINIFCSEKIIKDILLKNNALFYSEKYLHSYPYCWRHKTPVIYMATPQWFISMDQNNLRQLSLNIIKNITWIPEWGLKRMTIMLNKRPDWCISRQRIWGIPIPLFIHNKTNKIHKDSVQLIEKIACIIEKNGIQAWWDLNLKKILDKDYMNYTKVTDTLDVWFDSGSTYDSVMKQKYNIKNIDMYVEGSDQFRGWFISSLILSIATQKTNPYYKVISHGFTVDNMGKKMSKSLGNIIQPQYVIKKYGADILRLWVASNDYSSEVHISQSILKSITDIYRRIRNTIRFILSNLNDFQPKDNTIVPEHMLSIDKWIIHKTKKTQDSIIKNYHNYNIQNIIKKIMKFCTIELGSMYLDLIKDRQYTFLKNSIERLSCQTALYMILEALVRWIAPILSFTAHEIWQYIPGKRSKYIFMEQWYTKLFTLPLNNKMNYHYWCEMFKFREQVNKIIEITRNQKIIGSSLEADIIIYTYENMFNNIMLLGKELRYFLLVSKAYIIKDKNNITKKMIIRYKIKKHTGMKCIRCWYYEDNLVDHLCPKCINNTIGSGEKRLFI